MILIILAGMVIAGTVGFFLGLSIATKTEIRKGLREAGLTQETAKLLGRAARILNRMVKVVELEGDFTPDLLSEETKKQVNDWLAAYKKEINKV